MNIDIRQILATDEFKAYLSFVESTKVILLNSFLKKSTKQYKSEIEKANKILNGEEI